MRHPVPFVATIAGAAGLGLLLRRLDKNRGRGDRGYDPSVDGSMPGFHRHSHHGTPSHHHDGGDSDGDGSGDGGADGD